MIDRRTFEGGYIDAMLWACTYLDDEEEADGWIDSIEADAPELTAEMVADARQFRAIPEVDAAIAESGMSEAQAGHDFALTRNRHGAGYWDRGLPGNTGEVLTEAAEAQGERSIIGESVLKPGDWTYG